MSVTVTGYPKRTKDGNTSKWVALHNPIIYELQRKDITVVNCVNYLYLFPTRIMVRVNISAPLVAPDAITAGDFIYLKSGVYDVVGEVYEVLTATSFTLRIPYTSVSTGGFANLNTSRSNYRTQVDILGVNEFNTYYVIGSAIVTPTPSGLMRVVINEWLTELASNINDFDYSTLNVKDTGMSNGFNVRFVETWLSDTTTPVIQTAAINDSWRHFFVNAAKQVADAYGQNMAIYCPFPFDSDDSALFLCGDVSPTVFRGYPFDLQFIYSDNVSAYYIYRVSEQFDLNGVSLGAQAEDVLDIAGAQFVNRLLLPTIDASAKTIDVYLQIIKDDPLGLYSSGYAIDYAVDYYEFETLPALPEPPDELIDE